MFPIRQRSTRRELPAMNKFLLIALPALAFAGSLHGSQDHIVAMPMHQYKADCGTKSQFHLTSAAASFIQTQNVPGAGIKPVKAFETVLKDGFLEVDCVKDYMYYRGDKYGDNKHDYKLGPVSDVSIVHYDAFVAKEDQKEMTQKVCFEFCRTVPNMGFFGIVNGRGCYCTPYFTAMESDSSQCDAICEGENTLMCGGKSKSSIFAMHMCDSTKDDLSTRSGASSGVAGSLGAKASEAKGHSNTLQKMGDSLQKSFGQVGDSGAANTAQAAKVFAGSLVHKAEEADEVVGEINALTKTAGSLSDFTDPDTVTKAERTMEGMDRKMAQAEGLADELDVLNSLASEADVHAGASKQYYPVMYFVNKDFEDVPSTCSGDIVAEPMVGNEDACASACDANLHECVGYQYFKSGGKSMCALLSNFKTGFYYTGCGNFLQTKKAAPFTAKCVAKLSKFEGTTLKPDGSGKCKQCFKELTKANRCYA